MLGIPGDVYASIVPIPNAQHVPEESCKILLIKSDVIRTTAFNPSDMGGETRMLPATPSRRGVGYRSYLPAKVRKICGTILGLKVSDFSVSVLSLLRSVIFELCYSNCLFNDELWNCKTKDESKTCLHRLSPGVSESMMQ